MKHYKIGGSTAARTIACPAWIKRSETVPTKQGGSAAIEGSMLHEIMEKCRLEDIWPEAVLDQGFTYKEGEQSLEFTIDHLDLAEIGYWSLEKVLDEYDIDQFEVEPFVEIVPGEVGGSIDCLGLSADGKTVLVADYKFGRIHVNVEQNKQLMFYALAASIDPKTNAFFEDAERVVLAIIQPKVSGEAATWEFPVEDLKKFHNVLMTAVEAVKSDNPKAEPGKHCAWCPFEPYCKERKSKVVEALLIDPENKDMITEALKMVDDVEAWAKSVKENAHGLLDKGVKLDGWKLVGKRAVTKWTDEKAGLAYLTERGVPDEDLYKVKKTAITAPLAIKLASKLNKDREDKINIDPFHAKVAPDGTTMAPADDPREEIVIHKDNPENLKNLFKNT